MDSGGRSGAIAFLFTNIEDSTKLWRPSRRGWLMLSRATTDSAARSSRVVAADW